MTPTLVFATLAAAAGPLPAPPAAVVVTPQEQAALQRDEVVVRYQGPGKELVAVVDIEATPETTMREVMNLEARLAELSGVQNLEIYERSEGHVGARWDVGIAVFHATFHIQYDFDMALGWCVYALDESKENSIQESRGSYQVYRVGAGSRMVYRSVSVGSSSTPEWLSRRLGTGSARDMLGGIRARAEGQ